MTIPEEFLSRLRDMTDITDIVSPYVNLKRAARDYICLCPFHSEKTPSCHIYTESNSFYCFGCGAGGDAITFIRLIENLDYVEAVRFLAQRAGLSVPEEGVNDAEAQNRIRILEINRKAARFYRDYLWSYDGATALEYLRKRGLSDKIIKKFGLGFAPNQWQTLKLRLRDDGCSDDELLGASLIVRGEKGNTYDKFRNRIMFPIIDRRGNVIAFGGRILDGDGAKYMNSSETAVFQKRATLFALNFAKNTKEKNIILCEGNIDVIALYQGGFDNAVATLGTAITPEQARLLQNYCKEVIIAYDSDEAGQKAAFKAINLLSDVGITTKVLEIPNAKDPDEYLMKFGRESFAELIEKSNSAISFELSKIEGTVNLNIPEGRAEYLKKSVDILASINNTTDRTIYISDVALKCGVSVSSVTGAVEEKIRKKRAGDKKSERKKLIREVKQRDKINPEEINFPYESKAERVIIAYLFHSPDYLPYILKNITPMDFPTTFHRNLFEILVLKIKKGLSLDISVLGSEFSVDEVGRIEQIKHENSLFSFAKSRLDEHIQVLIDYRNDKNKKNPKDMNDRELKELIEQQFQRINGR